MQLVYGKYIGQLADYILSEIETQRQKAHFRRAFLVVPDARTLSLEQRYLERLPEGSLMRAEILSFSRLALRLAQEAAVPWPPLLSPQAQALVLRSILLEESEQFPILAPLARKSGYLEELRIELGSLRRLGFDAEALKDYARAFETQDEHYPASEKLAEMASLAASYDKRLTQLGKRDSSADLDFLTDLLKEWKKQRNCPSALDKSAFYFLGFGENRDFSHQEESVIWALSALDMDLTVSFVADYFPASMEAVEAGAMAWRQGRRALYDWSKRCPQAQVKQVEQGNPPLANEMECLYDAAASQQRTHLSVSESKHCSLLAADQPREMLEKVLGYIQGKVKHEGWRYKDFVLCFCEGQIAERYLSDLLDYFAIPAFIDERQSLAETPLFRELSAFMNVALSRFSLNTCCDWLRLSAASEDFEAIDLFENYALFKGVDYGKIFLARYYQDEKNPEWAEVAWRVVQEKLVPIKTVAEKYDKCKTVFQAVSALFDYLSLTQAEARLQLAFNLAMTEASAEEARSLSVAWNSLMSLLEDSVTLLPHAEMQAKAFRELLLRSAGSSFIGQVPSLLDEVYVGNPHTSLSQRPKQLILLNPSASNLPGRVPRRGVLSDLDYHVLERRSERRLPLQGEDAPFEDSFFIQQLLASGEMMPMIARSKEDSALPHFLLKLLGLNDYRALEQAMTLASQEDSELRLFSSQVRGQMEARLSRHGKKREASELSALRLPEASVLTAETVFSASRLERYTACPYSYLMQYVLGLRARPVALMDAAASGSLRHLLMEKLLSESLGSEQEALLNPEWLTHFQEALAPDKLLNKLQLLEAQGDLSDLFLEAGYFGKYTRPVLQAAARSAALFAQQFRPGQIWPFASEWSFGLKGEPYFLLKDPSGEALSLALRGQVDRIDQLSTASGRRLNLVDYKSYERKIDYFALWEGLDLQLPLYLLAVQKGFHLSPEEVGDAAYFHLKRISEVELQKQPDKLLKKLESKLDLSLDERQVLLDRSQAQIINAAKGIYNGFFPLKPRAAKNASACQFCEMRTLCAFDQPEYENDRLRQDSKKAWLEQEDVRLALGLGETSNLAQSEKTESVGD